MKTRPSIIHIRKRASCICSIALPAVMFLWWLSPVDDRRCAAAPPCASQPQETLVGPSMNSGCSPFHQERNSRIAAVAFSLKRLSPLRANCSNICEESWYISSIRKGFLCYVRRDDRYALLLPSNVLPVNLDVSNRRNDTDSGWPTFVLSTDLQSPLQ